VEDMIIVNKLDKRDRLNLLEQAKISEQIDLGPGSINKINEDSVRGKLKCIIHQIIESVER